jgi:hypothetical protein
MRQVRSNDFSKVRENAREPQESHVISLMHDFSILDGDDGDQLLFRLGTRPVGHGHLGAIPSQGDGVPRTLERFPTDDVAVSFVTSTATVKRAKRLANYGVRDPDEEWGRYFLLRDWDESRFLASLRAAESTPPLSKRRWRHQSQRREIHR